MTQAPITVVLIGPHGAGKTTLGRMLAAHLAGRFDDEIGARLRHAALQRDASAHAAVPQAEFDRTVIEEELARDAAWLASADTRPRVIETWHLGNLAYARLRSPAVAVAYDAQIRALARRVHASTRLLVQPLTIDGATLGGRQTEPGPPDIAQFFLRVAEEAESLGRELALTLAPPLDTRDRRPDDCLQLLLRRVAALPD